MTIPLNIILSILSAYLVGAIPTAYIFGKVLKGVDIRTQGSGNVGATNAFRVLGKLPGTIVLLLDIAKGAVATAGIADVFAWDSILARVILGITVVAGHNWTIFLNFKGGKGIATSLGVLIGLTIKIAAIRPVLVITLLSWIVVFLISRYVSLASVVAGVVLPVSMLMTHQPPEILVLGGVFSLWVVVRHRPNIKRLLAGTENRVSFSSRKKP